MKAKCGVVLVFIQGSYQEIGFSLKLHFQNKNVSRVTMRMVSTHQVDFTTTITQIDQDRILRDRFQFFNFCNEIPYNICKNWWDQEFCSQYNNAPTTGFLKPQFLPPLMQGKSQKIRLRGDTQDGCATRASSYFLYQTMLTTCQF